MVAIMMGCTESNAAEGQAGYRMVEVKEREEAYRVDKPTSCWIVNSGRNVRELIFSTSTKRMGGL